MKAAHLELIGPTMSIVATQIHVDFSGMASALASRSVGYLLANLLASLAHTLVRLHSEGLLVVACLLPSLG